MRPRISNRGGYGAGALHGGFGSRVGPTALSGGALGRPGGAAARLADEPVAPGIRLGAHVRHAKFGEGVVLNIEGQGPHARVQVNFESAGTKWLMLQFANLEPLR